MWASAHEWNASSSSRLGLGLAPWGLLQWPICTFMAAMAWLTVVQRILFVRRQLSELAEQTP